MLTKSIQREGLWEWLRAGVPPTGPSCYQTEVLGAQTLRMR